MNRRRALYVVLSVLALFLLGTVIVLSSVTYYLAIDPSAYLSEIEVPILDNTTRWDPAEHGQVQKISRIIHQTWKTESLPVRWRGISQACRDMMPDYEYMLWTDATSREFIAEHYSWFLDTFDNYTYNIQRADVIRYFVLHHYGGVYIDLDIGCIRPLDPLLVYPVILPKTIPVGVSNDLIFAQKGHPFLEQTIHNLVTFDHSWVLNYPTVMFSTGPMFLSAQYGIYTSSRSSKADVRILPKSLYGKNAKVGEAPNTFFSHFYGSSWHADDAAFIGFLGTWGKLLMWIGLAILIIGIIRMPSKQRRGFRSGYDVYLPRLSRSGRWIHLGWSALPSSASSTSPPSPNPSSESPIDDETLPVLLPFDVRPSSPAASDFSGVSEPFTGRVPSPIYEAYRRVRNRVVSLASPRDEDYRSRNRSRRHRYRRGVMFFLPAIFTSSHDIELDITPPHPPRPSAPVQLSVPLPSTYPTEKWRQHDLEFGDDSADIVDSSRTNTARPYSRGNSSQLADLADASTRSHSRSSSTSRRNSSHNIIPWDS